MQHLHDALPPSPLRTQSDSGTVRPRSAVPALPALPRLVIPSLVVNEGATQLQLGKNAGFDTSNVVVSSPAQAVDDEAGAPPVAAEFAALRRPSLHHARRPSAPPSVAAVAYEDIRVHLPAPAAPSTASRIWSPIRRPVPSAERNQPATATNPQRRNVVVPTTSLLRAETRPSTAVAECDWGPGHRPQPLNRLRAILLPIIALDAIFLTAAVLVGLGRSDSLIRMVLDVVLVGWIRILTLCAHVFAIWPTRLTLSTVSAICLGSAVYALGKCSAATPLPSHDAGRSALLATWIVAIAAPILEGVVLHFAAQRTKPDPTSSPPPPTSSLQFIPDPPEPDSPARRPRGVVPFTHGRANSRRRSGNLSGTSLPSDRMPLLDGEHLPSHEYRTFLGIPPPPVDRAGRDRLVRSQSYSETVHGAATADLSSEEEEETPRPRPRKTSEGDAPPAVHRWSIAAFDSSRLAAIFRTGAITAFPSTSAARSLPRQQRQATPRLAGGGIVPPIPSLSQQAGGQSAVAGRSSPRVVNSWRAVPPLPRLPPSPPFAVTLRDHSPPDDSSVHDVASSDLDPHEDDEDRLTSGTAPSHADLVSDDGDSLYISCPTSATTSEDDDDHEEDELDEEIERHGRDTHLLARSPPAFLRVTQSPWAA
ncbi:hypothetical protein, variant [Allomyces macrogynus ATCC 38327]|uniref:Uncharacterized protein n=1 Tax=Allomyces macrogynus (strain ATCC 38327) TaxID=578462 RepID=A0A0L0TAK2_ALLM3|nr:hypothetical protein, variant [Allomyces macrogynus ATCC 38327]|eukprot:KNE71730.1 hypothetical protein, variant [Allomyces macrogynus ATCC 38327]